MRICIEHNTALVGIGCRGLSGITKNSSGMPPDLDLGLSQILSSGS